LLEYKQFKDAADQLGQSAHVQALRYPREPAAEIPGMPEKKELDLEDVQVWDLLEAFDRLMASVSLRGAVHEVVYDDTPIDVHAEDLLDRLHSEGPMTFQTIFQGRQSKSEMIGLFLALLELIRRRLVRVEQDQLHGTIYISPRNPDEEVVAPAEPFGAEAPQDASPPEPAPPELPDTVPQLSPSAETHEVVPNNQFDSSTGHV